MKDIAGNKYNKLTVISQSHKNKEGRRIWLCICDCGNETYAAKNALEGDHKKSCGCIVAKPNLSHGMRFTREYSSWIAMKGRCLNKNHKDYPRYGAVGITICDEWANSFEIFFNHAGERPTGTTLDRIDNSKGYVPGNVRWATPKQQARNRNKLLIIETPSGVMPLVDYSIIVGISEEATRQRFKRGKLDGCSYVSN